MLDKRSLQQRLANLLDVNTDDDENYVSDILESLIDIGDSPDDVAEYLAGFVGNKEEEVRQLSLDVHKFKLGESVSISTSKVSKEATSSDPPETKRKILDEAAAQRQFIKSNEREKQQKNKQATAFKKKEVEDEQRRIWEEAVAARKNDQQPKSMSTSDIMHEQSVTFASTSPDLSQTTSSNIIFGQTATDSGDRNEGGSSQKKISRQQVKPKKGTPTNKPCGCFGNIHKPLKNCLSCGRISCELEGINDFCHFCGYFVGENNYYYDHDDAKLGSAMEHKERLLQFDRTSASRTQIFDDQEDYFVAATSMWSTKQEQGEYHVKEEERRKKVHDRQRNVISFT